ncbi:MAG: hypothetical protein ABEJ27_03670 [Halodesulfurarchaeum sp.]
MTTQSIPTVDKLVMIAGMVLLLVALPIAGTVVTMGGSMSPMVTYTQGDSSGHALSVAGVPDGAQATSVPLIGVNTRAVLVALALVLFALLAVYKLVQGPAEAAETTVAQSSRQ